MWQLVVAECQLVANEWLLVNNSLNIRAGYNQQYRKYQSKPTVGLSSTTCFAKASSSGGHDCKLSSITYLTAHQNLRHHTMTGFYVNGYLHILIQMIRIEQSPNKANKKTHDNRPIIDYWKLYSNIDWSINNIQTSYYPSVTIAAG